MDVAHLPSSLVHAVRDLLAILAVGLVSGTLLAARCLHVEAGWWAAIKGGPAAGHGGRRAAPTRTSALGAAVIGIPSVALTAAAVAAMLGVSAKFSSSSSVDWFFAGGSIWWLALALGAAVLVSGTGPLGVVAAGAAALPAVVLPVQPWLAGGDDLLLVQAASSLLACAVVTGWRPCFVWAAGALAGTEPPPPADPALPAPSVGDPRG